jgi:hypothetical protein
MYIVHDYSCVTCIPYALKNTQHVFGEHAKWCKIVFFCVNAHHVELFNVVNTLYTTDPVDVLQYKFVILAPKKIHSRKNML